MTDEEYGRAWAKQQKCRPKKWPPSDRGDGNCRWAWSRDAAFNLDSQGILPLILMQAIIGRPGQTLSHGREFYDSPALAYAALGAAVRRVHELVPGLKGEAK